MEIKRYKNYITWKDSKGTFNTECNRASLLDDLCLTINTCCPVKVALARERESKMSKDKIELDKKYYLSKKMIKYISSTGSANYHNANCQIKLDIARPITTEQNKRAGTTNYISKDLPACADLQKVENVEELAIRKLTEKECMLLMGFDSEDYKTMKQAGLSTQAIAHIAGDSIVTTCIVSLLSPLIKEEDEAHANIIEQYVDHIVETRNN